MNNYAYYYSNRRPPGAQTARPAAKPAKSRHGRQWKAGAGLKGLLFMVLAAGILIGTPLLRSDADPKSSSTSGPNTTAPVEQEPAPAVVAQPKINYCAGNTEAKFIRVSVEKRRLWACEGENLVRETAVITGLRGHAETETPVGTYKIYGKMTDTRLTGEDSRGAWDYPVHTWMPFLDNQYGTYGFHDATWRPEAEFGNISPDANEASHGCVELPLGQAQWLYGWAPVGTVLTVEA